MWLPHSACVTRVALYYHDAHQGGSDKRVVTFLVLSVHRGWRKMAACVALRVDAPKSALILQAFSCTAWFVTPKLELSCTSLSSHVAECSIRWTPGSTSVYGMLRHAGCSFCREPVERPSDIQVLQLLISEEKVRTP